MECIFFYKKEIMVRAEVILIAAVVTETNAIGFAGQLPWAPGSLPKDMENFVKETSGHAVIMGRKTWDSIPEKFKPFKNRLNIVITNKPLTLQGTICTQNLIEAIRYANSRAKKIFIIGGNIIYDNALKMDLCDTLIITYVDAQIEKYDTIFPRYNRDKWELVEQSPEYFSEKLSANYRICKYNKKPKYEEVTQYFNLIHKVLDKGELRDNRTNETTLSIFGARMEFDLSNNTIPLLTSKKMFWRGIVEELLWFISGSTDTQILANKGIHIWDGNSSPEFLGKLGLPDVGPIYGFQWRHFGAEYNGCAENYAGMGVDQLKECIRLIKEDPFSRRIIISSWNPTQLSQMALPPCHMMCQFYVSNDKTQLSCQMCQRSADIALGVPFNIASYALLTHIIASICGLKANKLIHVIGDAHIYSSHIDALRKQINSNVKHKFPRVEINPKKNNIDELVFDDIKLLDYEFTELDATMRMVV
jgi:dihydrofolate reductase/thymidylate synthase